VKKPAIILANNRSHRRFTATPGAGNEVVVVGKGRLDRFLLHVLPRSTGRHEMAEGSKGSKAGICGDIVTGSGGGNDA
jgi:hypothetical protein